MAVSTSTAAGLPFREAVAFFAGKTGIATEGWADVWRDAHSRSFMVAGAASDALVEDFRGDVDPRPGGAPLMCAIKRL